MSDKRLYLQYIKSGYNSIIKRQTTQLKDEQKLWGDNSPKKTN